jgi:pilus assembly protein CpaE
MPLRTAFVKFSVQNQEITKEFIRAIDLSKGFKVVAKGENQQPDLLIIELNQDPETHLNKITSFLDKTEDTQIFIVSEKSDPEILIKALRIGIKEFLPFPLQPKAIEDALKRFKERQAKIEQKKHGSPGKIFSVVGSKGGVGTTTIAVNLATTIALKQKIPSVALLDMNIVFGEVPVFLDMSPKRHWGDITKNIERLDEVFLSNILSEHSTGVQVLPSPRYLDSQPSPTPPIMEALLELMKRTYDYIIIDLGQSMNDTALRILKMSELVHIVAIQSLPCLSNTNRLIKSMVEFGFVEKESINIVLNRYFKKGAIPLDSVEKGIGEKLTWIIPNDYSTTMSAINSGRTLNDVSPRSQIVKNFDEYVGKLLPDYKKEKKRWFF